MTDQIKEVVRLQASMDHLGSELERVHTALERLPQIVSAVERMSDNQERHEVRLAAVEASTQTLLLARAEALHTREQLDEYKKFNDARFATLKKVQDEHGKRLFVWLGGLTVLIFVGGVLLSNVNVNVVQKAVPAARP